MKKYTFKIYFPSVIIFTLTMLPTIFWALFPAVDDVLRAQSNTPQLDMFTSFFQVVFVSILCLIVNNNRKDLKLNTFEMRLVEFFLLIYYISWVIYYFGIQNFLILSLLSLAPCLCFIFFAIDRKNYLALFPIVIFTIGHYIFTFSNFY